jgi:hypothetical protein
MAFEDKPGAPWYSVANPATVGERVTLVNRTPTYLLVVARKVGADLISDLTPQQSDYVRVWSLKQGACDRDDLSLRWTVKRLVPRSIKTAAKRVLQNVLGYDARLVRVPDRRGFDRRFFRPVDPVREATDLPCRTQRGDG